MRNRSLRRQHAINYLIKNPNASAKEIAAHADLHVGTVQRIIKERREEKEQHDAKHQA